jgi:hypothetical protein
LMRTSLEDGGTWLAGHRMRARLIADGGKMINHHLDNLPLSWSLAICNTTVKNSYFKLGLL